ncbi:LysR family transcriptional regulator [Pseudoruegeria sp. SHC-113]|uniref:LysR family transcriptional regulator n=1 Tax=Pseudoruegeria sp. SHC-113 TaxID=2855439 RepID=UPI0021BB59D4|nr:LysR family transcriptional regulator [Pseudoruegeria sp. SHC-113]MCT8160363.1 LysR family transcriptional regulator [Pseudoruegeria sp. SHC-113]
MDIATLKTLALVAQHGSFAAVARVLNLDPSSVSRAVGTAEATLGLRLFQRTTRALALTEEGAVYLSRIAPLLEEFDHAREAAAQATRKPSGTLRMTASVAFAHECVVPHLGAFRARYPEVSVELLPTDTNLDLIAGGIDLAIRLAAAPSGDLISTRLLRTRYLVCAAPSYLAQHGPIAHPEDLAHHPCLRLALPEYRNRWRFRAADGRSFEVPVSGYFVIANGLSLRQAAVDGLGPVLLADWLVARDLAAGRLVSLFPDLDCTATSFDTGAWALYPSRAFLPLKVRVMIDFLRDALTLGQSEIGR